MGQVALQSMSDGSLSEMGAADTGEPGSPGQASLLRDYAQAMSRVGQLEAKIAELMGGHTAPQITELPHQVAAVEGQSAERDRFKQGPDEVVTYEQGPSTESPIMAVTAALQLRLPTNGPPMRPYASS